ncbi:HalOD1 output domain-containing protein [Halobium salinum]|uniref:HalOD1 output domain-containing protein n=1 Tax=Halobium salinum TaxID=1364940 RepID=A0ABD5PG55_9EURY|nr:HalOD1 output domain-containing protein [Halobium salinum]
MPTDSSASTLVLDALANHDGFSFGAGRETVYEYVDLEALDKLFERTRSPTMSLQFDVRGATVTVWKSGDEFAVYVTDRVGDSTTPHEE